MSFLDVLKDSFKYPFKNFKMVLILGVIGLLSDLSGHMLTLTTDEKIIFPLGVLSLFIGVFGCGYLFKVIKTSLKGDSNMPMFDNWKDISLDGLKVFIVVIIYLMPVIITILYFMKVYPSCFTLLFEGLSPLTVAGLILGRFYWLGIPDLIGMLYNISLVSIVGFVGIGYLIVGLPLMFVSLVHMAKNNGSLKKAFAFIEIIYKIREITKTKLITWYILIGFIYMAILTSLFYANLALSMSLFLLLDWLICLIINPYLYIYSTRSITLLYKSQN